MKKICCFAGHSKLYDMEEVYNKCLPLLDELVVKENIEEFWVGNYGDFDKLASKMVGDLKEKHPTICLSLVLPYITTEVNEHKNVYYEKFDNIIIADIPRKTPRNIQIIKCNQYMIQNSVYFLCYISHSWGGAFKTLEYAKKQKNIQIVNLAAAIVK